MVRKSIIIKDVALEAGVSVSTVSHVMNNWSPTAKICRVPATHITIALDSNTGLAAIGGGSMAVATYDVIRNCYLFSKAVNLSNLLLKLNFITTDKSKSLVDTKRNQEPVAIFTFIC